MASIIVSTDIVVSLRIGLPDRLSYSPQRSNRHRSWNFDSLGEPSSHYEHRIRDSCRSRRDIGDSSSPQSLTIPKNDLESRFRRRGWKGGRTNCPYTESPLTIWKRPSCQCGARCREGLCLEKLIKPGLLQTKASQYEGAFTLVLWNFHGESSQSIQEQSTDSFGMGNRDDENSRRALPAKPETHCAR